MFDPVGRVTFHVGTIAESVRENGDRFRCRVSQNQEQHLRKLSKRADTSPSNMDVAAIVTSATSSVSALNFNQCHKKLASLRAAKPPAVTLSPSAR